MVHHGEGSSRGLNASPQAADVCSLQDQEAVTFDQFTQEPLANWLRKVRNGLAVPADLQMPHALALILSDRCIRASTPTLPPPSQRAHEGTACQSAALSCSLLQLRRLYLTVATDEDVVAGLQYALDNDMKVYLLQAFL